MCMIQPSMYIGTIPIKYMYWKTKNKEKWITTNPTHWQQKQWQWQNLYFPANENK